MFQVSYRASQMQNSSYSGFGAYGGVRSARGSVKYHLPRWREVSRWVGVSLQRVQEMKRGGYDDENGCNSSAK